MSYHDTASADARPPALPLLAGIAIWLGIALVFLLATQGQLALLDQHPPLWHTLWDASSIFLFYGALLPIGLWVYRGVAAGAKGVPRRALAALVGWLVWHTLVQFSFSVVEYWLIAPLRGGEEFSFLALVRYHAVRRTAVALLIFLGCLFFVESRRASWALAREEQRRLRISAELTTARLAALSGQLHPHFLFNTLNTIASLVRSDAEAAERVIERLSDLLRAFLTEGREATITLQREFDLLDDYLAIHSVRFPDRFSYMLDLPGALASYPVPPLLLQPLVENAIRHGLDRKLESGHLVVRATTMTGDMVMLVVEDDGAGLASPPVPDGVGLGNVRNRLLALHGDTARFDLSSRPEGGTRATIVLPGASNVLKGAGS